MRSLSPPFDPARLLAEAGWVRALAFRLVHDRELAEDVAQATLLAAIERKRAWHSERGARAWLGAVARNLARRAYRRERARGAVERVAARTEHAASASEAAERVELHRVLVEAVLALEEPYRSAVIWRHLDGASAEEIARRQGCSADVVRQRVSRALAKLRERLDRRFDGGRAAWCALLAGRLDLAALASGGATALAPAGAAAESVWIGGLAMASKSVWIGAAAIALAAAAWIARESIEPRRDRGESAASGPAALPSDSHASEAAADEPERGAAAAKSRESPRESSRAGSASDAREAIVAPAAARFFGRVVDRDGRAIAGVHVSSDDASRTSRELTALGAGVTLEDGTFSWTITSAPGDPAKSASDADPPRALAPDEIVIAAAHDLYAPASARARADEECVVVLHALPRVIVRLVTPDGAPAPTPSKAWVEVVPADGGEVVERPAEARDDGTFLAMGLPPGRLTIVGGQARGFAETRSGRDVTLRLDDVRATDLVLDRGLTVRGVVVDAHTREPIPHAIVYADTSQYDESSTRPITSADDQGRFEITGVSPEFMESDAGPGRRFTMLNIDARAEGYVAQPTRRTLARSSPPGGAEPVENIEIALEPAGCRLEGRVFDVDGARPAVGVFVWIIDSRANGHGASTDGDGRFEVADLPEGATTVVAQPAFAGQEDRGSAPHRVELVPGITCRCELVLYPCDRVLSGRVVDERGEPMPNVAIRVGLRVDGPNVSIQYATRETSTDEAGRWRVDGLPPGSCSVEASLASSAPVGFEPESYELVLEPGAEHEDVDFGAVPVIQVRGRVATPGDQDVDYDVQLRVAATGERRYRMDTAPDGSFAFESVRPDVYVLIVQRDGREVARTEIGPTSAFDLVLRASD